MKETQRGLPRFIEVPCSLIGLIVLSPLLCFGALLVAISSPGPILFRQVRIGLHGKKFMLYKFRTMKVAESTLQITAKDDNRITPLGRFLRKTKIDELPGLWNIVMGDMSIVGPRPEVEKYVDFDDPIWKQILSVRPGVTFPITLFLKDEEELLAQTKEDREEFYLKTLLPLKLQCYAEYIRSRNAWGDLKVILQTIIAVIFPHRFLESLQHVKFEEKSLLFRKDKSGVNIFSIPYTLKRPVFWITLGTDTALSVLAYYFAYQIRFDGKIPASELHLFVSTIVWVTSTKIIFLYLFRLYHGLSRYTSVHDLLNLLKAMSASFATNILIIALVQRNLSFSRAVYIIDFLLGIVFLGGFRLGMRLLTLHLAEKEQRDELSMKQTSKKRIAIIGAGSAGEKLLREIKENPRFNYEVAGFVDDNLSKIRQTIHGVPVLGPLKMLISIASNYRIDEIIIAAPSASAKEMRKIVSFCKITNLPFKTIPTMGDFIGNKPATGKIRDVQYEDLFGNESVEINTNEVGNYLTGKNVMVTGAAGSVGTELCRQIIVFQPSLMVLVDLNESALHELEIELKANSPAVEISAVLTAIQNTPVMQKTFDQHKIQAVFHAASYNQVSTMENHPWEAVTNNILGTQMLLELCVEKNIKRCIVLSSNIAEKPANVVGETKRIAELLVQAYGKKKHSQVIAVRFGDLIGSTGSVVELFRKQIAQGGPVTVTHKDEARFFMMVQEACKLILHAGAGEDGGNIYVLKTGTHVRIDDLARDMIALSGFKPDEDIVIEYIGLKPGERPYEEFRERDEYLVPTQHEKIMALSSRNNLSIEKLSADVDVLVQLAAGYDGPAIKKKLGQMIKEYDQDTSRDMPGHGTKKRPDIHAAQPDNSRARILIVDEDKVIADKLAAYLKVLGYSVSTVYSSVGGFDAIEREQFDIVVIDLMLSNTRGTELLVTIQKQCKKTGIIVMTGHTTIESNADAIQRGVQTLISKHFNFAELESIIEKTLREAKGVV